MQFIVDMFCKLQDFRLQWIRFNQHTLRADVYNGLADAIATDADVQRRGQQVILPSGFLGSPRDMQQRYLDSMTMVQRYGMPHLFITMTCNPAWPDIASGLLHGQRASDRPDLIARAFQLRKRDLIKTLFKDGYFGQSVAFCAATEFQKRGLPHASTSFYGYELRHDLTITTQWFQRSCRIQYCSQCYTTLSSATMYTCAATCADTQRLAFARRVFRNHLHLLQRTVRKIIT